MDPLTLGLGIAGIGMQLFGGGAAAENAAAQAKLNQGIAQDEQAVNVQKQQQMQLTASRMQMETFRNSQRQRAQATASAVNQGAQFGSGLQGGLAGVTDQSLYNALGVNQNLQFGNTIFGINGDISGKKEQLAQLGGQAATDQGIASLGGALVGSAGTLGKLGQNAGGMFNNIGSLFGGGSPSGYGK